VASRVDDRGYNQGFEWTPAQRIRMERRAEAILEAVAPKEGDRMLELGCGTGELASMLAGASRAFVTGVDLCVPFIEEAARAFAGERLNYVAADLSQPEGRERLGDGWGAIVGNGILHHLYFGIDPALVSMRQMLRPGGRLVFWEPNLFNPYVYAIFSFAPLRRLARLEPDEMAFTPAWIRGHLAAAGFTRIDVSFRDFLLPVMPEVLIPAVVRTGALLERLPVVNRVAQSLFICASAPD
jgi:SAM-dependent methyltransferase